MPDLIYGVLMRVIFFILCMGLFSGCQTTSNYQVENNLAVSEANLVASTVNFEKESFVPEGLVPGSDIIVESLQRSSFSGDDYYVLSNGERISFDALNYIRAIAITNIQLAELLTKVRFFEDKDSGKITVMPKILLTQGIQLYIIIDGSEYELRNNVKYIGESYLDIASFELIADDFTWKSDYSPFHKGEFSRKVSDHKVYEYSTGCVSELQIPMYKKISESKYALIEFQGDKGSQSISINQYQKEMIGLFNEINSLLSQLDNRCQQA